MTEKLLFIDTCIWLDFYRLRNETSVSMLQKVESLSDKIITTYQVDIEFKKNRQKVINDYSKTLKPPENISLPGIVADSQDSKMLENYIKRAQEKVKSIRNKLQKVLADPVQCDSVYQTYQRVLNREDDGLVLKRDNPTRRAIRHRACRRFLHGCPPRKAQDVSIGDAFNWEWMLQCAKERGGDLIIVSRDSDYGINCNDKCYVNDHLRLEFMDRVSKKRKIRLVSKLSEALKEMSVEVTSDELKDENTLVERELNAPLPYMSWGNDWIPVFSNSEFGKVPFRVKFVDAGDDSAAPQADCSAEPKKSSEPKDPKPDKP